jgi:hypothetical protein
VEDGRNFNNFIGKMKLKAMLASEIDREKLKHLALQYRTIPHKFTTSFKKEVEATEEDLTISVDKNSSNNSVKITF